jgi:predicted ATP-grasp superfamily ATP-dependent carboligase
LAPGSTFLWQLSGNLTRMGTMKILVTTGSWNAALVVMKSLARKGCQVHLLDSDPLCAGFHSQYCAGSVVTPRESNKAEYIDAVIKTLSTQKFDLLIPISDHTTEFLSEERERITPYTRMLLPSKELITLVRFKDKAYRFMLEHHIDIPQTYFPQSFEDVEGLIENISYPCVVKKPRGSANRGNAYFNNKKGLVDYYRGLKKEDLWPVIQEFVDGDFYGFTAVVHNGEILNCFMYTARQEYSLNGTPPYGVSIIDEDFFKTVQRIIRLLKWNGAINFDFLKDKDGKFKFLEINPRMPGSIDFAFAVGVDFPSMYLDLARGKVNEGFKGFSYKPGIKFRFVIPLEAIYTLKNKKHFYKLLTNFLNPFMKTDLSWDDPKLFVWKLRHVWWYWRDKRHRADAFNNSMDIPMK